MGLTHARRRSSKWDTQTTLDGARLPWAPVWRVTDSRVVRSFLLACFGLLACLLLLLFAVSSSTKRVDRREEGGAGSKEKKRI